MGVDELAMAVSWVFIFAGLAMASMVMPTLWITTFTMASVMMWRNPEIWLVSAVIVLAVAICMALKGAKS